MNARVIFFIGLFESTEKNLEITVCPRHRELYGIRWRTNKKKCTAPTDWSTHKSKQFKGDRGLTYAQCKGLYQLTNHFLPVGTRKYVLLIN